MYEIKNKLLVLVSLFPCKSNTTLVWHLDLVVKKQVSVGQGGAKRMVFIANFTFEG